MNGSPGSTTSGREGGWLIGGGLEFMCSPRWVFGLEYNYVKLDVDNRTGALPDDKPFEYRDVDTDLHTVTARVSFLLGHDPAPPPPLK